MRKLKKISAVTMALMLTLAGGVSSSAQVEKWNVYHNQGAPASAGVYHVSRTMQKGGSIAEVKMTDYTKISKTTITTYRKNYDSSKKYLTTSNKIVNLNVNKYKDEVIIVDMSTTESDTTSASGTITR